MATQRKGEKEDRGRAVNIRSTEIKMTGTNTAPARTNTSIVPQAAQTSISIVQVPAAPNIILVQAVQVNTAMAIPAQALINIVRAHHPANTEMVIQVPARISTVPVAAVGTKTGRKINTDPQKNIAPLLINTNTVQAQVASIPHLTNTGIKIETKTGKSTNIVQAVERKRAARKKMLTMTRRRKEGKEKKKKGRKKKGGRGKKKKDKKGKRGRRRVRKVKMLKLRLNQVLQ